MTSRGESQPLSLAGLYDPTSVSAILINFVLGYVVSQGVSQSETDAWADDIRALGSSGDSLDSMSASSGGCVVTREFGPKRPVRNLARMNLCLSKA